MYNDMQDVYDVLMQAKVNIDLIPHYSDETGFLFTVRLREYGNTMNKDQMILACGRDSDEALYQAAQGWLEAKYIPLNWRMRGTVPGICSVENATSGNTFDPAEARKALKARFSKDVIDIPSDGSIVPLKAVQIKNGRK